MTVVSSKKMWLAAGGSLDYWNRVLAPGGRTPAAHAPVRAGAAVKPKRPAAKTPKPLDRRQAGAARGAMGRIYAVAKARQAAQAKAGPRCRPVSQVGPITTYEVDWSR